MTIFLLNCSIGFWTSKTLINRFVQSRTIDCEAVNNWNWYFYEHYPANKNFFFTCRKEITILLFNIHSIVKMLLFQAKIIVCFYYMSLYVRMDGWMKERNGLFSSLLSFLSNKNPARIYFSNTQCPQITQTKWKRRDLQSRNCFWQWFKNEGPFTSVQKVIKNRQFLLVFLFCINSVFSSNR